MTDQETFKAWWKEEGSLKYMKEDITRAAWLAAIAHIKQNYTLCEKEPVGYVQKNPTEGCWGTLTMPVPKATKLYREKK